MKHPNAFGFRQIVNRKLRGDSLSEKKLAEGYKEIYQYINQGRRSSNPILGTILLHEYYNEDCILSEAWLTINGSLLTLEEVKDLYMCLPPYSEKYGGACRAEIYRN